MIDFHRENRRCSRLGTTPSKSIKNVLRSNADVDPHLHENVPFSRRLYQITKPSPSQNSTFTWSLLRLRKIKKAPDNNSPGNIWPITTPRPSKLIRILMGVWQRKRRALPGMVNIKSPSERISIAWEQLDQTVYQGRCGDCDTRS